MNDQERFAALRERLSRQMRIKELGEDGEKRILKTRFLVIGAGGLGSPGLLYLASSGASHITVVDPDEVSENNLSRQILHDGPSIGLNKAQNAARELLRWNPVLDIRVVPHRMADVEELRTLVREHDIVLDCSDNLATRQLTNRACFIEKKPLVFAAAVKLSGQVTVFDFRDPDSPCYRCLFEEDDAANDEKASTLGVFSGLTGTIGLLQATEALKLAAGIGRPLTRRMLFVDLLNMDMHEMRYSRLKGCPCCGGGTAC